MITISPIKVRISPPECDIGLHLLLLPLFRPTSHSLAIHILRRDDNQQGPHLAPAQGTDPSDAIPNPFSTSSGTTAVPAQQRHPDADLITSGHRTHTTLLAATNGCIPSTPLPRTSVHGPDNVQTTSSPGPAPTVLLSQSSVGSSSNVTYVPTATEDGTTSGAHPEDVSRLSEAFTDVHRADQRFPTPPLFPVPIDYSAPSESFGLMAPPYNARDAAATAPFDDILAPQAYDSFSIDPALLLFT